MENIVSDVHVSVPFFLLRDQYLPLILSNRLRVEIGLSADVLEANPIEDFKEVAGRLSGAGLACSFHAPFLDLSLGAIDPKIREVSLLRMEQVIELIPVFRPRWIVCHAAYESRHYQDQQKRWLENSLSSFKHLLSRLENTRTHLMVENVYEKDPGLLEAIFQGLNSPLCRFCLDAGHHRIYSRTGLEDWLDRLGSFLGMLHLHDNHGRSDDHLALGRGSIDFPYFFSLLKEKRLRPYITLEAHQEDWVRKSLDFLALHWPA